MNKQIVNKLQESFILDCTKKKVNNRERAEVITDYLKRNNISVRALSRELNIPHNTLLDWLLPLKITKESYDGLLAQGYSETALYRHLRNKRVDKLKEATNVDKEIMTFKTVIQNQMYQMNVSGYTLTLVEELRCVLDRFAARIEIKNKVKMKQEVDIGT